MKEKIKVVSDWITIICPAIIGAVGYLHSSGLIDILDNKGIAIGATLATISTIASYAYNIVTKEKINSQQS